MKLEKGTKEYIEFRKKANERNKKYYSKPEVKARKKIYKKNYDLENKENISKYCKKHNNLPPVKERVKKWKEDNKEHLIQIGKEWRVKNKSYIKEKDKEYNIKNKDKVNKNKREWYKRNIGKKKEYYLRYYNSDKGKNNYTYHNHKRLSIIKERPTDLTNEKIKKIFERDKVCVYCGSNDKLELDHIIPLKNQGTCNYNNFVVACKKCNTSKSGRNIFDWCKLQGISVPKIVLDLLKEQNNLNITIGFIGA